MNADEDKGRGKGRLPRIRAAVSCLLMLLFVYLATSGALLYFGKTGVVMGMARSTLRETHGGAALLMCALVIVHVCLNRRLLRGEWKAWVTRR